MTSKRFFSIGEVARETGYATETIRRLEQQNLVRPARVGAQRIYTETDIATIKRWREAKHG